MAAWKANVQFQRFFSPGFVYIYRAKYIFSKNLSCLYHFLAWFHGVHCKQNKLNKYNFIVDNQQVDYTVCENKLSKHYFLLYFCHIKNTYAWFLLWATYHVAFFLKKKSSWYLENKKNILKKWFVTIQLFLSDMLPKFARKIIMRWSLFVFDLFCEKVQPWRKRYITLLNKHYIDRVTTHF